MGKINSTTIRIDRDMKARLESLANGVSMTKLIEGLTDGLDNEGVRESLTSHDIRLAVNALRDHLTRRLDKIEMDVVDVRKELKDLKEHAVRTFHFLEEHDDRLLCLENKVDFDEEQENWFQWRHEQTMKPEVKTVEDIEFSFRSWLYKKLQAGGKLRE